MKTNLYNQSGEKLKTEVELNPVIFGAGVNEPLIAQYIRIYQANQRQGTVKTKNRGEVAGGGRKPWQQKGTGRARHGSIRSPLWVGGGIVFGPRPREWRLRMPRKMRRKALFSALSQKIGEDRVFILDKLDFADIKTKEMVKVVSSFIPEDGGRALLVLPELNEKVVLSARNLPKVCTILARSLNAYEVLKADVVVSPKASLKVIEETFLRSKHKNIET